MNKKVIPLAIGGLGIGATEFAIMGFLPDVASTFDISIPKAGLLISAYALGVVVGAPTLIGASLKYPPKKILLSLMMLFTIFNGLSAFMPTFEWMLPLRFLSGLPHGAFFGVGSVVAARIGGKGKEARYISFMFTGLTLANLAMVPFLTYIAHSYHWRWCFGIIALIGVLTILFISIWLPAFEARENIDRKKEVQFLKKAEPWYVLMITAIGFGGLFAWISYISPLMTGVSGVQESNMSYIMMLVGAGMLVGNIAGGLLSDKLGAPPTAILVSALMMASLVIVFYFSKQTNLSIFMCFVCGGLAMAASSPINMMIMKAAPGSEMMAAAFMQAAFNVANSLGAYLGSVPLKFGYDYNYPALVGAGLASVGLIISITYYFKFVKK